MRAHRQVKDSGCGLDYHPPIQSIDPYCMRRKSGKPKAVIPSPGCALPAIALVLSAACSTGAPAHRDVVDPALLCSPDGDMRLCKERCGDRTSGDYWGADGCRFNLHDGPTGTPYFATRSDVIDAEAQKQLDFAARLQRQYSFRINLVGHAAHCDDDETNQALSLRRAENVRQALLARGVPVELIVSVSGKGSSQSLQDTPPSCSDHFNDRVDLNVISLDPRKSPPG